MSPVVLAAASAAPPVRVPARAARGGAGSGRALVLLLLALAGAVLLSLAYGARSVPPAEVLAALTGGTSADAVVVRELRLPRTVVGLLVGAGLAVAGALAQGLTRNPLADPGLLGINAGAALGLVAALTLGAGSLLGGIWAGFAGAAVAAVLVHLLGTAGRGAPTPARLALAGVAVTGLLGALTSALVLVDRSSLDAYRFWAVGALSGRTWTTAGEVGPFVLLGLVLGVGVARSLDAVALGDEAAAALGTWLGRVRAVTGLAVVLLAGAATAAAGPVVFVGLVVPHVVRAWCGPGHLPLVVHSALGGGVLVLLADVAGRVVAPPGEVPLGIAVAAVGGPAFVLLVRRSQVLDR